jgi:hypothetical protein
LRFFTSGLDEKSVPNKSLIKNFIGTVIFLVEKILARTNLSPFKTLYEKIKIKYICEK